MTEPTRSTRPHHWRRRLVWLAVVLLVLGIAGVVLAPSIIPAGMMRDQVVASLAEQFGRPVSVASAGFSWGRGIDATEVTVYRSDARAEPLLTAERLEIRMDPLTSLRAAGGAPVAAERVRLAGVEMWLVRGEDGTWDLPTGQGPTPGGLQITDATVHVLNRPLDRQVTLRGVNASLGSLAGTGPGYVTLSARVPGEGEDAGRVTVAANLSALEFETLDQVRGSLTADWEDVDVPALAGVFAEAPAPGDWRMASTGHVTATLGRGRWNAAGSIDASGLSLPVGEGRVVLPRAVFGFSVERDGEDEPLTIRFARLSSPGLNLRLDGSVMPAAEAGDASAYDMNIEAEISWVALLQGVPRLAAHLGPLENPTGEATVDLRFVGDDRGPRGSLAIDLSDTGLRWADLVAKPPGWACRLEVKGRAGPRPEVLEITEAILACEAGHITAAGRTPLPAELAGDPGARPRAEPTTLKVDLALERAERLATVLPSVAPEFDRMNVSGAVTGTAVLRAEGGGGPVAASCDLDLTGLNVAAPDGPVKPAGQAASVAAQFVAGPGPMLDLESLTLAAGGARVAWKGTARLEAGPEGTKEGAFDGAVTVGGIEGLFGLFAPGRFDVVDPPMTGTVRVDLAGALAEGRVEGAAACDLGAARINAVPYFVKPSGIPASLDLKGKAVLATPSFVRLQADVRLPGIEAAVEGQSELLVARIPDPEPSEPTVTIQSGPNTQIKLDADIGDLERAVAFSPLAMEKAEGLFSGQARASVRYFTAPGEVRVTGALDLAQADILVENLLEKTAGDPLAVDAAVEVKGRSGGDEALLACETELTTDFGLARTSVAGTVIAVPPGAAGARLGLDSLWSLVRHADLEMTSAWTHGSELVETFPWLAGLYEQCRLEGPATVRARFVGSPLAAEVSLDVDAGACRISQDGRELKAAGLDTTAHLAAGYGDVPGELVIRELAMKLAGADAEASGRLIFDDPRRVGLAAPSAWTMRLAARVPKLGVLSTFLPGDLQGLNPQGGLHLAVAAAADPIGFGIDRCEVALDEAKVTWLDRPIGLGGKVTFDGRRLAGEDIRLVLGASDIGVTGYIMDPWTRPMGSIFVRGDRLDIDRLTRLVRDSHARIQSLAKVRPDGGDVRARARLARQFRRAMKRADVSADVAYGEVGATDAEIGSRFVYRDLEAALRLNEGRVEVGSFSCTLNDGDVEGKATLVFDGEVPMLSAAHKAVGLEVRENLDPMISRMFPGMEVEGTLTQQESKTVPLAGDGYPVGRGETVLTDGVLHGQAAPDYMTRLFPGLKLTTYKFKKMSNTYTMLPSGRIENRMIFDGTAYDVYLFGHTEPDGTYEYTLGVDLSVSLGSKTWSRTLDQGKIPLMYYTGRIAGTEMAEQQIRYVLPHELAYDVFVKRNLLLKLIKSLGRKPPDLSKPPELQEPDE